MKLNQNGRNELRKEVSKILKDMPDNQKFKLPKETLEMLLFETVTLNKEKKIQAKLPVWSGDFLRKLDLSEVDFSNVSWKILDEYTNLTLDTFSSTPINETKNKNLKIDKQGLEKIYSINKSLFGIDYHINYNMTNAKIDLTKSHETLTESKIDISACYFSGVTFINQDYSKIQSIHIHDSDISNSNFELNHAKNTKIAKSNLSGIDLSSLTINGIEYITKINTNMSGCNLANTGIRISLNPFDYKKQISKSDDFFQKTYNEKLKECMNTLWIGCYLNFKLIKSKQKLEENKKKIQEKYIIQKQEELEKIEDMIYSQVDKSSIESNLKIKRYINPNK